jgi:release factor glutamine methyltransferase
MKNSKALFNEIIDLIHLDESREEIESIAFILLEDLFSLNKAQVFAGVDISWGTDNEFKFRNAIQRINAKEPVQYVVGSAMFLGRRFVVNESVLIPRPETEELVTEVLHSIRRNESSQHNWRILDIGTGSGCIPVTCASEIIDSHVMATDVSEAALAVARANVINHKVQVQLLLHNILQQELPFQELDVVISNPPYIPLTDKMLMNENVTAYEPHLALFVPDDDPLLFYSAIALRAKNVLVSEGILIFETHEKYAMDVAGVLTNAGYNDTVVINDLSGKPRVVKATR